MSAEAQSAATELTLDQAAEAFAGLLSDENGTQETEKEDGAESADSTTGDESEEGESEAEAEESDDAEQEEAPEEEPSYTVKVDGKEQKVPLKELLSGYQRTADYTKKTQQLAAERRELESIKAEREHYVESLKQVKDLLEQAQPKEPDWDTLIQQDPIQAYRLKMQFDRNREQKASVEAEQAKVRAAQEAEEAKAHVEYLTEQQNRLLEAIPDWKDAKKASAEKAKLIEHGVSYGYTPEELAQVSDARAVMVLRKAMLYDQLQTKQAAIKPSVQQSSVKTARGGNASQSSSNDAARALKRLKSTGDVFDAAKVMEQFL